MAAAQTNAVVLLSGGLDSATTLAIARHEGMACHALSFAYGQRHQVELRAAAWVARQLGAASHRVITIDLRVFGQSALTADIPVPKDRPLAATPSPGQAAPRQPGAAAPDDDIPVTYVPARNTIFLSYALALAEVLQAQAIYIGVNAVDYSGYPDCRPEYIAAFERMANLATRAGAEGRGLRLRTPLIHWPKTRIIETGLELGVDFGLTHSCYDPIDDPRSPLGARPCGHCDSCLIRAAAFAALGRTDPAANGGA